MADVLTLFDDLVRVEIALWDAVDRRLRRDLGLPLGRVEALGTIASVTDCRVQDVAAALAITVGAASKLVDRLEGARLCRRRAHPHDRRSSIVETTPAGHDVATAARTVRQEELTRLLGDVPAADVETLARGLDAVRTRLGPRGTPRDAVGPADGAPVHDHDLAPPRRP